MPPGTPAHPPGRGADTAEMKTVTVAEAEAGISRLLRLVRKGETVVVVSRGKPVAEIRPAAVATANEPPDPGWSESLLKAHREGKIRLGKRNPDWSWLKAARERNAALTGTLQALLDEREEGR